MPSSASTASRVAGLTGPFVASFDSMMSTGSPGISRGMTKLIVSAAHSATA